MVALYFYVLIFDRAAATTTCFKQFTDWFELVRCYAANNANCFTAPPLSFALNPYHAIIARRFFDLLSGGFNASKVRGVDEFRGALCPASGPAITDKGGDGAFPKM